MSAPRAWTLSGGVFREGAAVPVTDRGFRHGMSVFEAVAVYRGRLLFAEEHLQRLQRACAAAEFSFPAELSSALSALSCADGMLRLYVTAGDGNPGDPCRTYALFDRADFPAADARFRLALSRAPLACVLGGWKTGNYWPHVQALTAAKKQGFDEALVFNAQGALVSAAMANVFLVCNGRLHTPALSLGARDGVVRGWVLRHLSVEESQLAPEEIENAEECFLTNSRIGVMPVGEIDGRLLPSRQSGE
ncbi:MAG: aminotransferase class IV, partial [Verrucomicrobiota bacterium]